MNSEDQAMLADVELEGSISPSQQPQRQRKKRDGPYRGPSRAKKYVKLRRSQAPRIKVDIPPEYCAVVGERALQFIGECSSWIKEFCPLNVKKWKAMPPDVLDQLYGRIKKKYELPSGEHVDRALKKQCQNLYRKWRERLKRKYYTDSKNLRDLVDELPPGVEADQWKWLVCFWRSAEQKNRREKNRMNVMSMKIHSACGAMSTARIIFEEIDNKEESSSSSVSQGQDNSQPKYIQLWIRTKRHANGQLDKEAEAILTEFQKLHQKQLTEKGVDDLTIEQAYEIVLGHSCGYARGLGRAHPVLSKGGMRAISEMQTELERLRARDIEMKAEIERLRASAQRKEEEALEREAKREEEAREREAKREEEAREREAKREEEAREREAKMHAYFMAEMGKFQAFMNQVSQPTRYHNKKKTAEEMEQQFKRNSPLIMAKR